MERKSSVDISLKTGWNKRRQKLTTKLLMKDLHLKKNINLL